MQRVTHAINAYALNLGESMLNCPICINIVPQYLLHSSGDPQREYARQAASDGVITYSYSSDNFRWVEPDSSLRWPSSSITQNPQAADQQQAIWIDTIFEFIDWITGVQFQKVEGQRGEIHLNFVPTLVNKRFKGDFTEGNEVDPVVNTESYGGSGYLNGYGQVYSFHNQAQYGALSDIRGIQTTLLEILGVTTPNGNGDDPAYSWDDTLMSYNDGGLGSFGATFFLTADDKAALQAILGGPSRPSPSGSKTHVQRIKEDLMLGTDGVIDTFKLISKGMILKQDAGTQYDDIGVIYNNYNIPYLANINPDEGDKILIHRSLLNPKSPLSKASKKLAKPFKNTKLRFKQIFGDKYTTGQNVYYNDAGKIYIDTNGKQTGLSSDFRYNSAGLAGQIAAFVDPIGPETIPFQSKWLGFFG